MKVLAILALLCATALAHFGHERRHFKNLFDRDDFDVDEVRQGLRDFVGQIPFGRPLHQKLFQKFLDDEVQADSSVEISTESREDSRERPERPRPQGPPPPGRPQGPPPPGRPQGPPPPGRPQGPPPPGRPEDEQQENSTEQVISGEEIVSFPTEEPVEETEVISQEQIEETEVISQEQVEETEAISQEPTFSTQMILPEIIA